MPSFFSSRIITILLAGLCIWFLLLAAGAYVRRLAAIGEMADINRRIEDGERDNARLGREVERMKQPAWLTLLARTRLNYKQADETVVFVYKSEKSGTISQPQESSDSRPNWRKWWDWILHR